LDYIELLTLSGSEQKTPQDTSFTVNAQRMANGCTVAELKNRL